MTLTQIKPLGLSKPVDLADNEKIRLGTGQDLEIFFDGTHSRIKHTPATGDLVIQSDDLYVTNAAGNEYYIRGTENGSVDLYYNNNKKFETTSTGVTITGRLNMTEGIDIPDGGDNNTSLSIGSGNDLRLYHDGNHSYIKDRGTGNLILQTSKLNINNADNTKAFIHTGSTDGVELYFDGANKFQTYADGVVVFNSANHARINFNAGSGDRGFVYADNANNIGFLDANADWLVKGTKDAGVELYYDGVKKAHTYSAGFKVDGIQRNVAAGYNYLLVGSSDASGVSIGLDGDSNGDGAGSDYAYIEHGSDGDLSIVCDNPAGDSQFELYVGSGSTTAIIAQAAGEVQLYHNGTEKLITESNGASVTGRLRIRDSGNVDLAITDTSSNAVAAYVGVKTAGHVEYNCYKTGVGTKYPHVFAGYTEEYARIDTNGIKFNGDTAAANALSDYEEGTWTPAFTPSTGSFTSISYNSGTAATYIKIGNVVTIWLRIYIGSINTSGASGSLRLSGLPFTAKSGVSIDGATLNVNYYTNLSNMGTDSPSGYMANNANFIVMGKTGGSGWGNISPTDLGATNFYACMTYYTA